MKIVGVILAGGRSNSALTKEKAAAILPVASYYSAIDFSLSSMVNSGIKKVAIVTQYISRPLSEHLKSATWWGFGRKHGGLFVLSPMMTAEGHDWYHGTIDALADTIEFLRESHEPYVAIASGDGIYSLDYEKVLKEHIESGAEITVVCKKLEKENRGRFGIINTDDENRITSFAEKDESAEGELCSCGIYLARRRTFIELIEKAVEEGKRDFVQGVLIPRTQTGRVFAYVHTGYWNNISADKAYYDCNMDFLKKEVRDEFFKEDDIIFTRVLDRPPAKYLGGASVSNSLIGSGDIIDGTVKDSVLFNGVTVGKDAEIIGGIVFPGVSIAPGEKIEKTIVVSENERIKI
ncbi:MAG: glucose-1-phosphate adenylyltransferase subunit GlgD [Lachnospiraceae bacterium]|nr:glucose-1-phosphate adenylyltransferase subunit GlgD [Lachnospiraceae bacterium]MBR6271796.1 glucose-1-phosphate adenylyltransferase subunit GlgD [Lachnospiraceae bacterium]